MSKASERANEDDTKKPLAESTTVPLSLSSLAYLMCLPRNEDNSGVLEGLLSVVHHTLSQVSSHSSKPIQATSWTLAKLDTKTQFKDLPYTYIKTCYLYAGKNTPKIPATSNAENWASTCKDTVVGCISLYYASSQENITDDDDEDMQQALLTKAVVEYKSLPSTGSVHARKQEEESLTSFGNGSVDDNVKLGALSSLHDASGKYVLKITSVRNKMYTYNVSDTAGMASVTVTNKEAQEGAPPLTRLEFTLEKQDDDELKLRPISFPSSQLEEHFLVWDAPASATALPSQQTLLLEKRGIFINGRLMQNAELSPSLFGFNLDGVPAWHNRIQNYEMVKQAYATLWQEIMIDARLGSLNIASTLLERLMNGVDGDDDDDADYEDDTNKECLESQLMASPVYDPVGICAKALATRFAQEFGKSAVPCLSHEVEWFQSKMAHKTPVVVPQRVINVLRRGGYFDLQRDTNEVWFSENVRPPAEGDERKAVEEACDLLRAAGCEGEAPKIMFVRLNVPNPVRHKYMCRYNDVLVQYHVNDAVWKLERPAAAIAMYVAQEYPDGNVLLKLMSK